MLSDRQINQASQRRASTLSTSPNYWFWQGWEEGATGQYGIVNSTPTFTGEQRRGVVQGNEQPRLGAPVKLIEGLVNIIVVHDIPTEAQQGSSSKDSYSVSILFYSDSGSNKIFWFQDGNKRPVPIATMPKRQTLGYSATVSGGSSAGSALAFGIGLGGNFSLDDIRIYRENNGATGPTLLSDFTIEITASVDRQFDEFGNPLITEIFGYGVNTLDVIQDVLAQYTISVSGDLVAGGDGYYFLVDEGRFDVGYEVVDIRVEGFGTMSFASISNTYNVRYLTRLANGKSIWSFNAGSANDSVRLDVDREFHQIFYGGSASPTTAYLYPTTPSPDPDDAIAIIDYGRDGISDNAPFINTLPDGTEIQFVDDPQSLIGVKEIDSTVSITFPSDPGTTKTIKIPGVPSTAEKVIAVAVYTAPNP